jgi:hypothetical protein
MGIEYPDVYKRFKINGDPDALYDEARSRPGPKGLAQDENFFINGRTFYCDQAGAPTEEIFGDAATIPQLKIGRNQSFLQSLAHVPSSGIALCEHRGIRPISRHKPPHTPPGAATQSLQGASMNGDSNADEIVKATIETALSRLLYMATSPSDGKYIEEARKLPNGQVFDKYVVLQDFPRLARDLVSLICKSALSAKDKVRLAQLITLFVVFSWELPHDVHATVAQWKNNLRTAKARVTRTNRAALLDAAVEEFGHPIFRDSPKRGASYIAAKIENRVNERIKRAGAEPYLRDTIRRAVSRRLHSWKTVQSSD